MPSHEPDAATSEHAGPYDAPPQGCQQQDHIPQLRPSTVADAGHGTPEAARPAAGEVIDAAAPATAVVSRSLDDRHRACGAVVVDSGDFGSWYVNACVRDQLRESTDVVALDLGQAADWPMCLVSTAAIRKYGIGCVVGALAPHVPEQLLELVTIAMDPRRKAGALSSADDLVKRRMTQNIRHVSHLLQIPHVGGVDDLGTCIGFIPLIIAPDAGDRARARDVADQRVEDREFVYDRVYNGKARASSKTPHYVFLGQVPRSYAAIQLFWVVVALTELVPYSVVLVGGAGGTTRLPDGSTKEKNTIGGAKVYFQTAEEAQRAVDFTHCALLGDLGAFIGAQGAKEQFVRWHEARKAYLAKMGAPFTAIGPLAIEAGKPREAGPQPLPRVAGAQWSVRPHAPARRPRSG